MCLGMWQATAAQDIIGKLFGGVHEGLSKCCPHRSQEPLSAWFAAVLMPVAAFVSCSYSHTVANMFW